MGQSSLPKWVLGTIEFIWAGGIPLPTHHKMISSQKYVFRDPCLTPKRDQNVDPGSTNLIPGSKIRPPAWKNKRCALKNYAEPRPRNCKRSHIAQVMAKNHFARYPQNLGICFKKGNPVFKKGILFSRREILLPSRGFLLSRREILHLTRPSHALTRPGHALQRILEATIIPEGVLGGSSEPVGGLRDLPRAGLILGSIFRENM